MRCLCRSNSEPSSWKGGIIPLHCHHSLATGVFPVRATTGPSMRLNQRGFTETGNYRKGIRLGFLFGEQNLLHLRHHYRVHLSHSSMRIWMTGKHALFMYHPSFTFGFGSTFSLAKEIACVWRKAGRDLTHLMDIYKGCKACIIVVNELSNYRWPLNCGCTQRRNPVKLVQFYSTDLQSWPNCVPRPADVKAEQLLWRGEICLLVRWGNPVWLPPCPQIPNVSFPNDNKESFP